MNLESPLVVEVQGPTRRIRWSRVALRTLTYFVIIQMGVLLFAYLVNPQLNAMTVGFPIFLAMMLTGIQVRQAMQGKKTIEPELPE